MIRRPLSPRPFSTISLIGILVSFLLVPRTFPFTRDVHAASGLVTSPLVSRNAPAYTNDDCLGAYPAGRADDNDYNTLWRSCQHSPSATTPIWLAYDLSTAHTAAGSHLGQVVVAWYNDPVSGDYDTSYNKDSYNVPSSYTIDVNAAPGGISPPTSGWTTLVTVTGNTLHSRQHVIDMTGDNWVRFTATASTGWPGNSDIALNMDVHDASGVPPGAHPEDDWIFFGDSITAAAMSHGGGGKGSFAQLINQGAPAYYPIQEDGGIGYLTSASGASAVPSWLSLFFGTYVGLSYGVNDALGGCSADALSQFYANYVTMIQAVLAHAMIPVIPHLSWGTNSALQACVPLYNAQIDALYAAYPQVLRGPDLWAFFRDNPTLISPDGIHPTDAGVGAYRQLWAQTALAALYSGSASPPPTPTPGATASPTSIPTDTATSTATPPPTPTDTATPPPTPTSTPVPTDTPTNTPLPTPTATDTPTPTSTAPPPTDTATPTSTPSATPTPTTTATASPTSTPTSLPSPAAGPSSLILYDNAVTSAFQDGSYGYTSRNPQDGTIYVSPPYSYAIAYQGWGGIEFGVTHGTIDTSQYRTIEWNLNPNGQPVSDFGVFFGTATAGWINEVVLTPADVTAHLGNGWMHVSVPVSELNPQNVPVGTIQLKNALSQPLNTIHVDDVVLNR